MTMDEFIKKHNVRLAEATVLPINTSLFIESDDPDAYVDDSNADDIYIIMTIDDHVLRFEDRDKALAYLAKAAKDSRY